ncbi:VCBS repeat-containing protein [Streptomyces sp. NBC_01220]|uniref:FG-GAP-like repeat-containing protein n=1 Tax=Streptomyces TaxID=1883 RepID=UPI001C5EC7CD|nr:FG-GAP-like repeat-containing protein [Streptomyces poriferorum]MBW5248315.1 VCBS repeat-containing protein [Streptomyces poriferorum]MBW5255291.1 VCBS repeat-containing protein [Streptomyces poriferorum]WSQ48051.1 VCBS repeat-containing protein [Streptomyces sp. NBC_01220]
MRTHTSRRALRLASTLVAAGLALTAAPHALAATGDDGSAMKLTSQQADKLASHMGVDVYGDNLKPINAGDSDGDEDAPVSGLDAAGTDASAPVTFTNTSALEGVRGIGATVPAGSDGSYFTVHSLGNVQLHKADGTTAWTRSNQSLYTDWQAKPLRVWQVEPYPAHIVMGYSAVSPFTPASDQGFDTGDLTGDGTADLVFSASVGSAPYRPITSPGSSLPTGTFVTVLDGKTGKMLWSKLYSYATGVKLVEGTLLVGNAPTYNVNAPAGETATLTGTRFSYADGALTPTTTWTYDTKSTEATWGALESAGAGKAAVSWDLQKTATTPSSSRTLVLDVTDGSVGWHTDSTLYSRQLHLDTTRNRLVALEQADPTDGVRYEIVSYAVGTGARATLDNRSNAVPTAMTIGDLKGTKKTEYAVAESAFDSNLYVNASTVRVLDGTSPDTALWSHTTKRNADNPEDGASTWRLDIVDGSLAASSQNDSGMDTAENAGGGGRADLTVFNGKGAVRWQHRDNTASPMFQQVFSDKSGQHVRVIDQEQNVRTFDLAKGAEQNLTPLQGDLSFAQALDVDGDKKQDVVAGGTSHGVWAYSGTSLLTGKPKKLWQATVAGQVHAIATGDVTGDSKPEIIVAADTATTVLDSRTGKTLTTIDGGGAFVRSVTVADVNGTGKDEILVPTDALRVYNGNGKKLWQYAAPADAGDVVFSDTTTADGRVYTQYTSVGAINLDTASADGVALNGKNGNVRWTASPKAPAQAVDGKIHGALLDHAVFASPDIPYADGHAVVYTWIVEAVPDFDSTSAASAFVVAEIRDGRTGELLHQKVTGSPWSHGNFFTGDADDGLLSTSFGTIRVFGADGQDGKGSVSAPLRTTQFITGPGGRKLLAGGVEGGVGAWDPAILTSGDSFSSAVGSGNASGGRNYLAADLDGDGAQEMISLNFNTTGYDRMAEELGGRVLSPDNNIHQMTTFKLS